MKTSNLYMDLRIHFECSGHLEQFLNSYKDSAGIWTIGLGTTHYTNGISVKENDTCTIEEAKEYALFDTNKIESFVSSIITSKINQSQFDSLCDFSYNAGIGSLKSSTLLKIINENPLNFEIIKNNFEVWNKIHVDGKLIESSGLLRRRKCEFYLYKNGINQSTFFL